MRRAALLLLFFALDAHAITIDDYIGALSRCRTAIATQDFPAAHAEARALRGAAVEWPEGRFRADESLLAAIENARQKDLALLARLDVTLAELRHSSATGAPPDPKLLQQVAAEQAIPELAPGGTVATTLAGNTSLLEQIAESIARVFRWIRDKIRDFLRWLRNIFRTEMRADGTRGMRWMVITITVAIAIVILLLAIQVIRRSRRAAKPSVVTSEPLASRRDDDPLSRGATEWERYAAQLASQGRFREAIRAWYHAVLVTSYSAGVLHFRKGRTNWEYVATLSPSLPWRPEMIELTRRFEQEWYGADHSTPDALEHCSGRAQRILAALRGAA
ncbi:MAG TPA: DUF4129 domain-containing protein [Thermoanaerobaculia bacterium]|nr:DUF4129 domain-containing protein [Thermoanaerobaculia bacterium]